MVQLLHGVGIYFHEIIIAGVPDCIVQFVTMHLLTCNVISIPCILVLYSKDVVSSSVVTGAKSSCTTVLIILEFGIQTRAGPNYLKYSR